MRTRDITVGCTVKVTHTGATYRVQSIDAQGWCNGLTPGGGWHPDRLEIISSAVATKSASILDESKISSIEFKTPKKFIF